MDSPETGTLTISRVQTKFARLRSYAIIVDGTKVRAIKEGETVSIPLTIGQHSVFTKIDWTKSNIVEINTEPGQTTRLHIVRERVRDWRTVAFKVLYVLVMLVGAILGIGALVGAGAAMLIMHRSGKLQLKAT